MLNFAGGKMRKARIASLVLGILASINSAWALDLVSGDFQQILRYRTENLVVWQYSDNPNIYVFDFPGLTYQGKSFNRITQFTEQQSSEPYPRVLADHELERYMQAARRTQADFAFGHDVMVSELVQFFNFALRDKVTLNAEETALRDFLVEQGMIRMWRGFYQALRPEVVILTVPQVQNRKANEPMITEDARFAILLHEMAHGEYYSNQHYAKYCQRFWYEKLSEEQRERFKQFLSGFNYAVSNEELLINEMQAYLMFTPDPKSFSAKRLGVSDAELLEMRETFRRGKPPTRLPLNF